MADNLSFDDPKNWVDLFQSVGRRRTLSMGARAILRVLPIAFSIVAAEQDKKTATMALNTIRVLLIVQVIARFSDSSEPVSAAFDAQRRLNIAKSTYPAGLFKSICSAARLVGLAASDPVRRSSSLKGNPEFKQISDAIATVANGFGKIAIRTSCNHDLQSLQNQEKSWEFLNSPLWGTPPSVEGFSSDIDANVESELGSAWSFWVQWYRSFLDGKPLDWELQKEIALIPDAAWNKGPEHIAKLIEDIQARYLTQKLPQAEDIEFNQDTGRFFSEPRPIAKPDLLGATLEQVSDALDDVLADPSNGLNDKSREVTVLGRTIAKYGNNPQRVEMDLTSVHASLTRQIATEELPPSEENLALQRALQEGAQGIRATDPEIEENRRLLTGQALKELPDEKLVLLEEALPMLEAISEGELAEDWGQDIPFLLSAELRAAGPPSLGGAERNPVLAGYDEKVRVFGRAGRIMILIRKTPDIIHKIDGHPVYKAAGIVTTIAALVTLGIALI